VRGEGHEWVAALVDTAKVLEVNADFFVRRVLPVIQGAADRLAQSAQTASGGTSGSPTSSMPDSATAT